VDVDTLCATEGTAALGAGTWFALRSRAGVSASSRLGIDKPVWNTANPPVKLSTSMTNLLAVGLAPGLSAHYGAAGVALAPSRVDEQEMTVLGLTAVGGLRRFGRARRRRGASRRGPPE